jgi:hypothetical protein
VGQSPLENSIGMPSAAHQRPVSEVATVAPSVKIAGGSLVRFTRHPKALARVCALELQACARFVLEVLLTSTDAHGVTWVQAKEIASITPRSAKRPRYALPSVLRGLRQLRDAGLISWQRVAPLHRYPRRNADKSLTEGAGKWSQGGGRTWVVDVAKIVGLQTDAGPGMALAGSITHDRSGSITHDRSFRISGSPSENLKKDRASPPVRPPAAPARVASGTPPSAHGPPRAASLPGSADARPRAAKVASETPGAASAPSASQPARREGPSERARGEGEHDRGQAVRRVDLGTAERAELATQAARVLEAISRANRGRLGE